MIYIQNECTLNNLRQGKKKKLRTHLDKVEEWTSISSLLQYPQFSYVAWWIFIETEPHNPSRVWQWCFPPTSHEARLHKVLLLFWWMFHLNFQCFPWGEAVFPEDHSLQPFYYRFLSQFPNCQSIIHQVDWDPWLFSSSFLYSNFRQIWGQWLRYSEASQ